MNAIVVVDKKWGIGKNNDLLFKLPEDMKYFRQKTLNKIVVMGSNTLKSFPDGKPLKKQEKLRAAALLYLSGRELDVPARFDVAEVYTDVHRSAGKTRIRYIANAF